MVAEAPLEPGAIAAAGSADVIELASGSYNEAIDLANKAITLRSTDPSDPS